MPEGIVLILPGIFLGFFRILVLLVFFNERYRIGKVFDIHSIN